MKLKVLVRRPFGEVEIEGSSLDELVENLKVLPDWLPMIEKLVAGPELLEGPSQPLQGLIEKSQEGPILTVAKERISDKEAVGLLLYAAGARLLEPKNIASLLELSGRPCPGLGARLSELRREGLVLKDGAAYRLSVVGRSWVEDVAARLRGG
ncbi:MAG: hypothetical protein QW057_01800 [Candidatus Bathyarchaeia archaeon]